MQKCNCPYEKGKCKFNDNTIELNNDKFRKNNNKLEKRCIGFRNYYAKILARKDYTELKSIKELIKGTKGRKTCSGCKENLPLTIEYFYKDSNNDIGFESKCKNCRKEYERNKNAPLLLKEIPYRKWKSFKTSAEKRNIQFNVTIEFCVELLKKQNYKCALSGLPIEFSKKYIGESTASLDRIKNELPYTNENIQWVHKDINYMKGNLNNNEFIEKCKIISEFYSKIA